MGFESVALVSGHTLGRELWSIEVGLEFGQDVGDVFKLRWAQVSWVGLRRILKGYVAVAYLCHPSPGRYISKAFLGIWIARCR